MVRILCADIRLAGKPHHDWKEGYELMYAFRKLGHTCDIAGPNGYIYTEVDIPKIANNYDLIIVTENYPSPYTWKWWNWGSIKTPKLFWALDTHIHDYRPLIQAGNFDYVAFGIQKHQKEYQLPKSFPLYYAVSTTHQKDMNVYPKIYDTVFIGSIELGRRKEQCERFGIKHMNAFGAEYIKTMKQAKLCFNSSMSNDINAKYFEIMSSGSFMLTNFNQELLDFCDENEDLRKCMYTTDEEIGEKINYYLEHEEEREEIAKRLYDYIWENHTWESRCKTILDSIL
jgi:hypothetical protein